MAQTVHKPTVPLKKGRVWYDLDPYAWYDLDPFERQLWVVEGPAGYQAEELDPQELPAGFRWVDTEEWDARGSDVQIVTARTDRDSE